MYGTIFYKVVDKEASQSLNEPMRYSITIRQIEEFADKYDPEHGYGRSITLAVQESVFTAAEVGKYYTFPRLLKAVETSREPVEEFTRSPEPTPTVSAA